MKKKKLGVSNAPYDVGWWVTDGGWWVTDGSWRVTARGEMRTKKNTKKKKPNTRLGVTCTHEKDQKTQSQKDTHWELNLGPWVIELNTTTNYCISGSGVFPPSESG